MFILKSLNKKVIKSLSVAFFVMTLVFYPSLLGRVPTISSPPEIRAIQEISPEIALAAVQFDAAYASSSSESSNSKGAEKKIINFFKMAMGALAGLVLFIFGVTRLSEGLEELGTDRMKNFLSKWTSSNW